MPSTRVPASRRTRKAPPISFVINQTFSAVSPIFPGRCPPSIRTRFSNGGPANGQADQIYLLGLNLTYHFTHYFSTEVGYNYDKLDSSLSGRAYDRNRVYVGLTATY